MRRQKLDFGPQQLDLDSLYAGDGITFRVIVTDAIGVAQNLTGTMKAQIRATYESEDPSAEFEIDLDEAEDGIASLLLPGEQTAALVTTDEPFEGVWDLEWTAEGEEPKTLVTGRVRCDPDVSR